MRQEAAPLTHTQSELRALLTRFGVSPRRSLGQHFVVDPETVRRIARISGVGHGDRVLEIGAGLGSLTLALVETGADVLAVEVDRRCAEALGHTLRGTTVEVVEDDVNDIDFGALLAGGSRWTLVANLPYNIATPLLLDLLRDVPAVETMVIMVQREAGERLAAPAGSRARGIPSVLVERAGTAELVAEVGPWAFYPQPEVQSVVVRIDRHRSASVPSLAPSAEARFEDLLRAGFGQRRKMVRRSLAGLVGPADFERVGVEPTSRPEELSLRQWTGLAQAAGGG